jgi:amidohydrolase
MHYVVFLYLHTFYMRIIIILLVVLMLPFGLQAQPTNSYFEADAMAMQPELVQWRRQLHEHPELGNREFKTSTMIAAYLRSLGLEVQTNIAKTGVVAILKGVKPGPVIALRADMDALPVKERVNLPYASKDSGEYVGQKVAVMHACGHDAHVAMLLGAATVLTKNKKQIAGTIKFIFQPAEEGPPPPEKGGASLMVQEGVLDNPKVDVVFGMHISSELDIGKLQYKPGAFMAGSDVFSITVKGKSSHGSQPWKSIDPVVTASQIINSLQTIVSRQMDLTKAPVVITVGKIQGGVRNNIIPEDVYLEGTIRTLDSTMREAVLDKVKYTATQIALANYATAEVSIKTNALVTFNNIDLVKQMLPSLQKAVGANNVSETAWKTGAEDFSYYGTKAPAFYFYIGGKDPNLKVEDAPLHHTPDFFIDDSKLYVGVKTFCQLVMDYKKK